MGKSKGRERNEAVGFLLPHNIILLWLGKSGDTVCQSEFVLQSDNLTSSQVSIKVQVMDVSTRARILRSVYYINS